MKKLFCSLLSIVLCIGICTGCGGKKNVVASTGETTFSFTAAEFKEGFNKIEKDESHQIGEYKHTAADPANKSSVQFTDAYTYQYDTGTIDLLVASVESNKKVISVYNMATSKKDDTQTKESWVQNNSNIFKYADASMTDEKMETIIKDLGINDEANWQADYEKAVVVDGIQYLFKIKDSFSYSDDGKKDYSLICAPEQKK